MSGRRSSALELTPADQRDGRVALRLSSVPGSRFGTVSPASRLESVLSHHQRLAARQLARACWQTAIASLTSVAAATPTFCRRFTP